jgi:all-trans-retinol 13,14-reductase
MELRKESLPIFAFAHGNSSFIQSSWRLKGDGNLIVEALIDGIRNHGGKVVCQAEVEELIERDGRIVAARCTDGETYEGDTFISDIHPVQTFNLVKESRVLKRIYRRRIGMLESTFGMFTASLVLKPGSMDYFNHNKFVYRNSNVWDFYESADGVDGLMVSARVPEEGSDLRQIDLLTPMPWSRLQQWADTRVGHRGDDYLQLKRQMALDCIQLAETVIPGLRDMVSEVHTSTPLTYRDYTLTPEGAAYGARKDCRNMVVTMLSPRTPLPNLLLTGQSVMLPGLEGVAMTAMMTVKSLNIEY